MSYSLIFFDTNESDVIPSTWMFVHPSDEKTYCYYPMSVLSESQMHKAVVNRAEPDIHAWPTYACRVIYTTGLCIKQLLYILVFNVQADSPTSIQLAG